MKKFAYYLPGRVRHQFTDDFSIPLPPPEDMVSWAVTRATAQLSISTALDAWSWYTIREVSQDDYLDWFRRVGRPHLFSEELRES